MNLQRLAIVVLFLFVTGLVSAAAGEALHASAGADEATHAESSGPSCPDSGDDGKPCGPMCPCTCCPGHLTVAAFVTVAASVTVGPTVQHSPSSKPHTSLPDGLHPKDTYSRIFHPPRA